MAANGSVVYNAKTGYCELWQGGKVVNQTKGPCAGSTTNPGGAANRGQHHSAGGPTSQLNKTGTKHHADAVAAKKKSKLLIYGGVAVGVIALGLIAHHFMKHHKA